MQISIDILSGQYLVDFTYKVSNGGAPQTGPSYYSGGEPAESMEYEIIVESICTDNKEGNYTDLELPIWLKKQIEIYLMGDNIQSDDSQKVYDMIEEAHRDRFDD